MNLPEYPNAKNTSEIYSEHNIKLTKKISSGLEVYTSVKNLFNYTQNNPLIAPDRPFSEDFATDHVFGPIQERRFQFGIKYEIK
jgi:hypothetical protein